MTARTYILALLMTAALSGGAYAQDPPPAEAPPADPAPAEAPPPPAPDTAEDIRQVQIQIWITQTDEDGLRELGTNLNYTRFVRGNEQSGSVERVETNTFDLFDTNPSDNRPQTFEVALPAPDGNPFRDNVRLTPDSANVWAPSGNTLVARPNRPGEFDVNSFQGAGLSWSIVDADRGTLDGIFRGVETKTDSDLISKPEILVINEQSAEIQAGEEFPYQNVKYDGNGNPQLTVEWKPIGVNLKLRPTILSDEDLIQIDIENLEVIDRLRETPVSGFAVPVFSTRSQNGSVLVPNGQTLVVGGLSSRVERTTERRVPIVGRLPIVGIPFRGRKAEAFFSHLLIFVSPTVVDLRALTPPMENAVNFWQNSEWRNTESIADEVRVLDDEI
jgi:type II secretory pathway component GspD/PulD (secretin)